MCGIGLIVSGIRIDLSSILLHDSTPPTITTNTTNTNNNNELLNQPLVSIHHLKRVLQRRGPDSLGIKKLLLHSVTSIPDDPPVIVSALEDGSLEKQTGETIPVSNSVAELYFIGATLQLRGLNPITQPFVHPSGNILIYNGEIFGGIVVERDCNDGEVLFHSLTRGCSCNNSVADVLSRIKGPWAVIYWQASTKTLWFGRDAFGRRSLLVHWPNAEDSRFLLSSVSSFPSVDQSSDSEVENGTNPTYWDELSCGIYSLSVHVLKLDGSIYGHLKRHEWANTMLMDLIKWERVSVQPKPENLNNLLDRVQLGSGTVPATSVTAQSVLRVLRESVMRHTSLHQIFQANTCDGQEEDQVPVAVLFSGGLDSMILAALLDECLDPRYGIDLLNVSFDGANAPDRISARTGLKELKGIAPSRRWKLVEINADLSKLTSETKHVMSLIHPANTYMDLNIGTALWLAARGDGWVFKGTGNNDENSQCFRYKSTARIILVGSGADEQCAGYGRHRTKYRCGSWLGLNEEMKLDMQRIWKRNMGRDDRCIADNGKEARFPFLDEDVIRNLLDIPLWEIANLDQPSGTGDKKILREVARMLGLYEAAVLPKRAIQFGSRIARESNRRNFGSNRAANQASAGSVVIPST